MHDTPWQAAAPLPPLAADPGARAALRRYARAQRLTQFARELATWQRLGTLDHPRNAARVAYRRACLDNWATYLDGWQPEARPQGGRRAQG